MEEQVLGDLLLRGHVAHADERQHLVRPAGGEQGRRQPQRVGGDDVVVGEPVDQQERAREIGGERDQRARVVAGVVVVGMPQVALGVVRVVEPPVGHRRAGDRGVEHVGPAQHGERREVTTEAPPADGDPVEVEHVGSVAPRRAVRRSGRRAPGWRGRGDTVRSQDEPRPGVPRPSATTTAKPWSANHCDEANAFDDRWTRRAWGPP